MPAPDPQPAPPTPPVPSSATFWDGRYGGPGFVYGTAPNDYLASQAFRLRPGMRALVPGDGEGRNGVWLAEQGLDVVTVDASAVGVEKAREFAAGRGVAHRLHAERGDLTEWAWPRGAFDVVASVYLHLPPAIRPRLHAAMRDALRPGGLLVIEAFRPEQIEYQKAHRSGGPSDPGLLYTAAMLRADFAPAEPLELTETVAELREGPGHDGPGAVVRGVFRSPG